MTQDPLVSILIPVYNGANYLAEAVESALAQTYPHVEVIVVDDGSSDGGATRAVAAQFGERIRYVSKPNGGVATALNEGIKAMRGRLFSWLSHDDLYKPDKVSRQVEAWKRFEAPCVVIGDFETMNEQCEPMSFVSIAGRNLVSRPLDAVFYVLINGCALLIPRELFDQAGVFEPGLPTTQDYHLWYRMARLVPFVHCPYSDVRQRVHDLQGSRQVSHLHEASRMFAYLLDITPVELMEAYDGSELRFLLKVAGRLSSYPGLGFYLRFRIGELIKKVSYSVLLCSGGSNGVSSALERLSTYVCPPAEIITIDLNAAGRFGSGRNPERIGRSRLAVFPDGTSATAVFRAGAQVASTDILICVLTTRVPSEAQLRTALETVIQADSDITRPSGTPETASELDGLVMRRSFVPYLTEYFAGGTMDRNGWPLETEIAEYPLVESFFVPAPAEILDAFHCKGTLNYSHELSEAAIALLLRSTLREDLPTILFLSHSLGGGTQTHLVGLTQNLAGRANCLVGFGRPGGSVHVCREPGDASAGLVFLLPEHLGILSRILLSAGVRRVDVFHTLGFEGEADLLLNSLRLPFDVTLVDYHLVANDPHLASGGVFPGDEALLACASDLLRPRPLPILRKAARVIATSRDLAARTDLVCPGLPMVAAVHWDDLKTMKVRCVLQPGFWGEEPLRILIVGPIVPHKGRALVLELARVSKERDLPLEFHVTGQMDLSVGERAATGERLIVHGAFEGGGFNDALCGIAPHVGWLPAQVPETWSYVLSDFFEAALPVAATAIGALRERCYGRPFTWLLPHGSGAEKWLDLFSRLRATRMREPPIWESIENLPAARAIYFEEYLHPA